MVAQIREARILVGSPFLVQGVQEVQEVQGFKVHSSTTVHDSVLGFRLSGFTTLQHATDVNPMNRMNHLLNTPEPLESL
jgi:hypothetical protein